MDDLYDILGVKPEASIEEIRQRYRFLAMAYHPDRFPDPSMRQNAEAEMKRINMAYAVLSNPQQRAEYDRKRKSYEPSETSKDAKSGSSSQSRDTESQFDDVFQYLTSLMIKWQSLAEGILKSPHTKISEPFQEMIHVLHTVFPHEDERQEILSLLVIIILTHIALGAEAATNGINPRFKKEWLENVLLQMFVAKLHDVEKDTLWYYQVQKPAIERLVALLATAGALAQSEGASRAKFNRHTEERVNNRTEASHKQTTSQSHERSESSTQGETLGFCHACMQFGQVKKVTFRKNVGMVFVRRYSKLEGELCGRCIEKYFWSFTATTLFLGWWGVISFPVSPFILIANVFEYLGALPFVIKSVPGWIKVALGSKIIAILGFFLLYQIMANAINPYPPSHRTPRDNTWAIETPASSSFASFLPEVPTPTFTLQPSSTPTPKPTPTTRRSSSSVVNFWGAPDHCVPWSDISSKDKGKLVCVYGVVRKIYWDDEGNNHIVFSDSVKAMRFVCHECYFPDLGIGDCVFATSTVKVTDGVPYFVVDELYMCR